MLYATCSVFRAENQDVIAQFLREEKSAKQIATIANETNMQQVKQAPTQLDALFLPDEQHDGFYYALLQKC